MTDFLSLQRQSRAVILWWRGLWVARGPQDPAWKWRAVRPCFPDSMTLQPKQKPHPVLKQTFVVSAVVTRHAVFIYFKWSDGVFWLEYSGGILSEQRRKWKGRYCGMPEIALLGGFSMGKWKKRFQSAVVFKAKLLTKLAMPLVALYGVVWPGRGTKPNTSNLTSQHLQPV